MEVQPDFKELLELFNKHGVDYLIVGAFALAMHGVPRNTGDLDILVKPEKPNAERILAALKEFGFGSQDITIDDIIIPGKVIQLGMPPVRIDIITSITGVSWEDAYDNLVEEEYGGIRVNYLGLDQLIANKKALGRYKDLADLDALGEAIIEPHRNQCPVSADHIRLVFPPESRPLSSSGHGIC